LKALIPQKLSDVSFTNPTQIHGRAATAKSLITKSNVQMRKRRCHDRKPWTSDNWKRVGDMVRGVALHAVPNIRKSLPLKNTQGSLQTGITASNSETRGKFCDGLGSNIVVQYSVCPIMTLEGSSVMVWVAISW
jgi:hypothetical protein